MGRKKGKLKKLESKSEIDELKEKKAAREVYRTLQTYFQEKKLKKEQRVVLLEELASSAFKSDLLLSSKNLRPVETRKEKIKRNASEADAGLPVSFPNVTVRKAAVVEKSEERVTGTKDVDSETESEDSEDDLMEYRTFKPVQAAPEQKAPSASTIRVVEPPTVISSPSFFVTPNRPPDIQEQRLKLPICAEEQEIMEAINGNPVVVICGETGSGKTTQVPQFLYESGYSHPDSQNPGKIGVTQPRRVAAISMAARVAKELNLDDRTVAYQVRYDATVGSSTKIKFMTDGILLKEVSMDFLLKDYSALIIDEAHERNLNTDILIGLLSRIVGLRDKLHKEFLADPTKPKIFPLKLVIMSATLRVEDFTMNKRLFSVPPPVINVQTRQYKVTTHFSLTTKDDYLTESYRKVCQIHKKLPPGGILVFLTGQDEILALCRKLEAKFRSGDSSNYADRSSNLAFDDEDDGPFKSNRKIQIGDFEEDDDSENEGPDNSNMPLLFLPLYSSLPPAEQKRVFGEIPAGSRLCVIATNVAETSLTIPNIKYVVDCGKVKQRNFDLNTGIEKFEIEWISKASADQRSGRSGRTEDGHCYRLYSSAVFENQFPLFSDPEVLKRPLESVILLMKSMGIENVVNFPFPTDPGASRISFSEKLLVSMESLDSKGGITPLGKLMARFPIHPRHSKMLFMSSQVGCLPYMITIVSGLTVGDFFLRNSTGGAGTFFKPHQYFVNQNPKSDYIKILTAIGAFRCEKDQSRFCVEYGLNQKMMKEIILLEKQLTSILRTIDPTINIDAQAAPPTLEQQNSIRQICLSGLIDRVAKLHTADDKNAMPTYSLMYSDARAKIHPHSSIFDVRPAPEYVVYGQSMEATGSDNLYLKEVTIVCEEWLSVVGRSFCQVSKPLKQPAPFFDSNSLNWKAWHSVTFGPRDWPLHNIACDLIKTKK